MLGGGSVRAAGCLSRGSSPRAAHYGGSAELLDADVLFAGHLVGQRQVSRRHCDIDAGRSPVPFEGSYGFGRDRITTG